MSRASALSPPAGRMLRPWRPPSRVTAYGSLAVASFVCYIAAQLLDAPLAKRFAIIGLGACGWSWLLTRALFDPAKRDVRWARIVGLTVVVTGGLTALVPSGGELSRFSENIYALSGSAALLLEHIGQRQAARRIEGSVVRTLEAGRGLTRDLGGDGTTASITEQLIANL